jgi:hypothetical protein
MSTDKGLAALERMAQKIRGTGYGFADLEWRDDMIRGLREALKFYADERNYHSRSGFEDRQNSVVDCDRGDIARAALEGKR